MFERFTDRARRALVLAQEEARLLSHNYIGTEHLLLGLIHEGTGLAAQALESLGISLDAVRGRIEDIIGQGEQSPSGHVPFTPRAKRVLELSAREADALGSEQVGTEHLLLGLLREGEGVAVQALVRMGADLNGVRHQVLQLIRRGAGADANDEGSRPGDQGRVRIDSLRDRLTAVERWVGMRPDLDELDDQIVQLGRDKKAAIDRQDFKAAAAVRDQEKLLIARRDGAAKDPTGAPAGRPSLAGELARLSAELDRLRATLRQHGIEPGDGPA